MKATRPVTTQASVLRPGESGYEELCAGWNLAWTQRPAVAIGVETESDVVAALRLAADEDLAVAVQNTGHGIAVPADGDTALIVISHLDDVTIDPRARTATVGGGASWEPVLTAAQRHGLSPLLGSAPHVGVVGYTLGGGFGWLARRYGLAVDSVRALRVALADGRIVTTSPTDEAELYWAMCGSGGSSLGVVTEITLDLAPVATVVAGNLFFPLEDAHAVFEHYLDWTASAPEELTSAFNITAFPPLEIVPEQLRGQTFAIVRGCWCGDPREGDRLLGHWRSWRTPLMDTWGPMEFSRSAEISMDPIDPLPAASSGKWLTEINTSVLEAMLETVTGPMLFAETRHAGAAVSRPNPSVSFSARHGERMLEFVGLITGPGADEEIDHRMEAAWARLGASLAPLPGYLNFAEGHEKAQAAHGAFDRPTAQRLAAAKRRYDPENVFRHGIPLAELGRD